MKIYRHPNGRVQHRDNNGKFRKTTLADFGINEKDINKNQKMLCLNCGKTCMPILKTVTKKICSCGGTMIWQKDFDFDTWLESQPEGTFVQGGGLDGDFPILLPINLTLNEKEIDIADQEDEQYLNNNKENNSNDRKKR